MKKFIFAFILILFSNNIAFSIEEVNENKVYYLTDCIELAVKNSPIIKQAKLNTEIAKKDVSIAKSNYFPTLEAGTRYWQGFNTVKDYDDGYNKRFLPSVGLYLNQLIFDFGKTSSNIDMKKFYQIAAEFSYIDSICDTINDIKLKYFSCLEAKAIVEIEENNLLINQKILEGTKELLDSKKKNKVDYINAELYLSSAKINLTDAKNAYNQALVDLANSMYIAGEPSFEIKNIDTFDYYDAYFSTEFIQTPKGKWHELKNRERQQDFTGTIHKIPFTIDYAYESTYKNNPELKALDATLEAMKKSALFIKRQYYPSLNGRVGYEYNNKYVQNKDLTYNNNQLNVSLNLDSSFNGLKYNSELAKANMQIELAKNNIELFKQNLFFDVKRYYMDVETAQIQIGNSKDNVYKALENLDVTSSEYAKGNLGYLELQTARQNYNNSKIDYIKQLRNYNIALSKLERITHIHEDKLHQIAHKVLGDKD